MKLNSILYGLAVLGAAFLQGCSNDNEETFDVKNVHVENSDVEIHLSTGSVNTRASVESDDNHAFEVEGIGVFCLAKGDLNINPRELPINWIRNSANDSWSVWMDNVAANAVIEGTRTALRWQDDEATYWYPTGNWHSYRFYGYYPRQEEVNLDNEVFTAEIAMDGTQDVIWGRTASGLDEDKAYSAYFFRQYGEVEQPTIPFTHRLMRLTFSFVAGPDANGSTETAKTMGFQSLELFDVPSKVTLVVADRNDSENEGKIIADWDNNLTAYNLLDPNDQPLPELDAAAGTGYWTTDDEQTLGQGFLVPVPEDGHTLQIRAILQNKDGQVFNLHEYPMDINLAPGTKFEAGKSYNAKIIVNGPRIIEIFASLAPWVPVNLSDMEF